MRRTFKSLNILRSITGVVLCALSVVALAGPIKYSTHATEIRAGVLISDANQINGVPANNDPYVWYNLDRNSLVKPAGWYFDNPHATTQVTPAIAARWQTLTGMPFSFALNGSQITKANAPYWEVNLSSINDSSISDYDVLILPVYGTLSLNPAERSRLQRFVDQGGVLWIDVASTSTVDVANGTPLAFEMSNTGAAVASELNPVCQLLTYPYTITSMPEANYLSSVIPVDLKGAGYANYISILCPVMTEFNNYEIDATAGPGGQATILSAHSGNGAIVVTSRGEASFLNNGTANGGPVQNIGFTAIQQSPDANANQVAKLAVNAISLVNGAAQNGQGSHKNNGSPIDVGAPLIREWADETNSLPISGSPPITYKGLVIVAGQDAANPGSYRLYAYSAVPGSDLDLDGDPDDGIQDLSLGFNRDLIWQSVPLKGPLSAPVAVQNPASAAGVPDIIGVVDGNQNVLIFNAFPLTNGSFTTGDNPILITISAPNGAPAPLNAGQAPFNPTVHEGLIYVTDKVDNGLSVTGRVWVADPTNPATTTKDQPWSVGGSPNYVLPETSGGVTIGYIPIADNSGGVDGVAYVPTASGGNAVGAQPCGITSIWVNTKGEKHPVDNTTISTNGGGGGILTVSTRASQQNRPVYDPAVHGVPDPHGIHIALETANGDVLSAQAMSQLLKGSYVTIPNGGVVETGVYQFDLATGATLASFTAAGVVAISIDYWIDWDYPNGNERNVIRGSIQLPDDSDRAKNIVGDLALSPAGTLYAVEADPGSTTSNGMFFALREQGQGAFNVISRFDLYSAFTLSTPGITTTATNSAVPATFEDNDPTQNFSSYIGGKFTGLVFQSGPSIADGRVFVKARGVKTGAGPGINVPCMLLLCFNAEPALPSFTVPPLQNGFTILQPDYNSTDAADKTQPTTFTQVQSSSGQLTYTAGTDHGTISLTSLSSTQRGLLSQTLNESLPIIIRQPGVPDIDLDPSLVGSWNPLQWYTVFYGLDPAGSGGFNTNNATGSPVVTGSTVFAAANSYLPAIFQNSFVFGTSQPTGMLIGFNAAISPTSDQFTVPNVARPYFEQITQTTGPTSSPFAANPDLLWPQGAAADNASPAIGWTIYQQRLYQTVLDGANLALSPYCFGITAGEGTLFAYSNIGVYGFKRADFTVADEGRLASFDPAGNAMWTSDQSISYGLSTVSAAGQVNPAVSHPLVRPTRAYPIGSTDYLVVDPGSNRLARIDISGHEIRSIEGFFVDPKFQPDGYVNGEPTSFNQPQDVLTYVDYPAAAQNPFTNPQALEYWRHYVIADTGNRRLIEIVDRYTVDPNTRLPNGVISLGSLFYHSPANLSGKKGYDYNSVARLQVPGSNPASFIYATSLGTTEPTRVGLGLDPTRQDTVPNTNGTSIPFQGKDARDGNGGIIVLSANGPIVINQVVVPAIAAGVLYNPSTGTFNTAPIPAHYKKLGNLSSVSMAYVNNGKAPILTIMFTDSTGVYEINLTNNPIGGTTPAQDWVIDWMMPTEVYTQLRRDPTTGLPNQNAFLNATELKATYARRTTAGTVLLVNGYFGMDQDANQTGFPGEIIELNGDFLDANHTRGFSLSQPFLGFDSLSITFQLPAVQGARGIIAPIFADRR